MGFESGSTSFRMFYIPRALPGDTVERFARAALPPMNLLGRDATHGWVGGRHLLDRNITEVNAFFAGTLRLSLVRAERRIPPALLRAECALEELARMQAEDKAYLSRAERSQIRKDIMERLLPQMPPTLTAIPMVYDGPNLMAYAGATSEKKTDAFVQNFSAATEVAPVAVDPATAAMRRRQIDVTALTPISYSPELENALASADAGMDFLTWLWFHFEAHGGHLEMDGEPCSVMVEGPLTLFLEGDGAHVAQLRNGAPLFSTEAKTALLSGKKLQSARIHMARNKEIWSATLSAPDFTLRGFKFPQSDEKLDATSAFQQRMLSLDRFTQTFLGFYDRFLTLRTDPAQWPATLSEIHAWVQGRATKR